MRFKTFLVIIVVICEVFGQSHSNDVGCGRQQVIFRVYNGIKSERDETLNNWSWLVAFAHKISGEFFCAGSLISEKHVLSAAHCFKRKNQNKVQPPQHVSAFVGKYNLSIVNEPESTEHSVWQIILHPDWKSRIHSFDADIAVVVLYDAVDLNDIFDPICLPRQSNDEVVGLGTIVGWGRSEHSDAIEKLHDSTPNKLKVQAVSDSQCSSDVPDLHLMRSNRTFCAGFLNQSKAPCVGDNGGGFYLHDLSTGRFIVQGIISASIGDGFGGCNTQVYSVFTTIARFSDWIKEKMEETKEIEWKEIEFNCESEALVINQLFETSFDNVNSSSCDSSLAICSLNSQEPMTRNLKIRPNFSNHETVKNAADVTWLHLKFKLSTHIFNGIGETFQNLKKLEINRQKIKYVERENFANLTQLQVLSLFQNDIEILPENVFYDLSILKELIISENRIAKLSEKIFVTLKRITTIDINTNRIQRLPKYLLSENLELENFDAEYNPMKTIDIDFTNFTKIHQLNFGDCKCINFIAKTRKQSLEAQQILKINCTAQSGRRKQKNH